MIRFLNESSPQTTAYTVRLWSFHKPVIIKDTSKYRANTFGFHSINGKSAVDFQVHSKKENAVRFLKKIWENNPGKKITIIDNLRSHHSNIVMETALLMNIRLIFLPPYSPDLNPLEFIWKSIRRVISTTFIDSEEKLRAKIDESFQELSGRLTFSKSWAKKFLEKSIIV